MTRVRLGASCDARHWYYLTLRVLGVVLGFLWIDLVVVAVLDLAATTTGRPLIQEIWSADTAVTGMVAVRSVDTEDKGNTKVTTCFAGMIVVLLRSCLVDGQLSSKADA